MAFVALFLASGFLGIALGIESPIPEWFSSLMLALNVAVGGTIVFTLLALFAKQREDAQKALRSEHERAEGLLLNILPRSSPTGSSQPADSPTSSGRPPSSSPMSSSSPLAPSSSRRLKSSACWIGSSATHTLAEQRGLEKIKTTAMLTCASGVPIRGRPRRSHRRLALDTSDTPAGRWRRARVRIGSIRPVVAGVIGRKQFLYDLWGDAVNVASRMESQGTLGGIQITCATYDLRDDFACSPGARSVKGKGDMRRGTWSPASG